MEEILTKICKICNKDKNIIENFYQSKNRNGEIYYESNCKNCKNELLKKNHILSLSGIRENNNKELLKINKRICSKCLLTLELEKFLFVKKRNNYETICKDCKSELKKSKYNTIDYFKQFIVKSKLLWGENTFDYSKVNYINAKTEIILICNKHNKTFTQLPNNHLQKYIGCSKCQGFSKGQDELYNYIISICNKEKVEYNYSQYQFEIDIYLPNLKIGIEYNGNYWHSNLYREKFYHQNKMLFFLEKGIQIVQIWEHEWICKNNLIKNKIKNILNLNLDKIYARKTKIKELIYSKELVNFCLLNHIQGFAYGDKIKGYFGLYNENDLVALIILERYNNEIKIKRYCSKINIVGGFTKLLNYYIKNYCNKGDKIITFADARFSKKENMYLKNGFSFLYLSKPNYFYFKSNNLYNIFSREKFQKHKLGKLLNNYNENLTEQENMVNNNYIWCYDAGNWKLEKEIF